MNLKARFDRPRGVTLVELMVVIAVAGILAAVTAPSIQNAMRRERQRAVVSSIANTLRQARDQAMSRGEAIYVIGGWSATTDYVSVYRTHMHLPDNTTQLGTTPCNSADVEDTCPDGSVCMEDKCWGRPARSCRELSNPHTTFLVNRYDVPAGVNTEIALAQGSGTASFCFSPDGRAEDREGGFLAPYSPSVASCTTEGFNFWIADKDYPGGWGAAVAKLGCASTATDYEEVGGAVIRVMANGEIGVRSPRP